MVIDIHMDDTREIAAAFNLSNEYNESVEKSLNAQSKIQITDYFKTNGAQRKRETVSTHSTVLRLPTKATNPADLNSIYGLWSKLFHELNVYKLGCHVCYQFDEYKSTMYAKKEYPNQFTQNDVINNTAQWIKCRESHHAHAKTKGHINAMGVANNCDYFNSLALSGQIEVAISIFRDNIPEYLYAKLLFMCHRTNGFVGDVGHSVTRLNYYMHKIHKFLKLNVTKQLYRPRPWKGL